MDESRIRIGLPVRLCRYHSKRLRRRFSERHKGHKHLFGVIVGKCGVYDDLIYVRTNGGVYCKVYADEIFEVRSNG